MATPHTDPMTNEEDVKKSNDEKIDTDFKDYPDNQGAENIINPKTEEDKKTAALDKKDGEKMDKDEIESDASGGAFDATEAVRE